MTISKEIGRNMVMARHAQALTQEEVAFRSNRSVNCLQAVEYGCKNVTVDTLISIAGALGIDSRVIGIFSRTDKEILSEIRQGPHFPSMDGGELQICTNIVLYRKNRGMTQKKLAFTSGMSTSYLRDIEKGCANMTIDKLLCIAKAFELSLVKLNFLSTSEEEIMEAVYMARAVAGIRVV